jgi:oligopeptidase B
MSVPYKDNGYFYFTRYEEKQEYPLYCRKKGSLEGDEEVMLNVNDLAIDYAFYNVGGRSVSPDNRLLAFGEDTLSRRIYSLRVKNLETGEFLPVKIENTTGSAVWANDNKTLFYSRKDETLRSYQIWKHKLGTDPSNDALVFEESDPTFTTHVYKTKSREYIVIGSWQTLTSEMRFLSAYEPDGEFRVFLPRERDHEYAIAHFEDKFYIKTNWKAQNFRLMTAPINATSKEEWTELIPNREDVLLEGMDIFHDYLVLSEREEGITRIRIMPWEGDEHYIEFKEDAYLAYVSINPEFDTKLLRIGYQSMTTPNTIYDYDMVTRDKTLLKQEEVLGDFDSGNYVSTRLHATARDGKQIPVSLVWRKETPVDGTSPCLLYGYGSYGISLDPYFSSTRLSLLDRGFVYAIAHIRGGEELGRQWYEDGKLQSKKNTFKDFIDCGQYLIDEKYADPDRLFAMGGSAGGLLMGAIINMQPDMWGGIIAAVPFVDVVTTMLDESIPLTTGEYDEWGNPNDPEYYAYIKSYSPYDNIEAKAYPPMLVTTGLHDSQVQYWEPAKWVAKLREMKTDQHPLLMYCNMETGHSGASGRFQRYKETAMEYAFLLDLAGKVKGE